MVTVVVDSLPDPVWEGALEVFVGPDDWGPRDGRSDVSTPSYVKVTKVGGPDTVKHFRRGCLLL